MEEVSNKEGRTRGMRNEEVKFWMDGVVLVPAFLPSLLITGSMGFE